MRHMVKVNYIVFNIILLCIYYLLCAFVNGTWDLISLGGHARLGIVVLGFGWTIMCIGINAWIYNLLDY